MHAGQVGQQRRGVSLMNKIAYVSKLRPRLIRRLVLKASIRLWLVGAKMGLQV